MNIIFLLILVSLVVAVGFLGAFIWAVKSGQYEDDYTPSVRMLFDDKPVGNSTISNKLSDKNHESSLREKLVGEDEQCFKTEKQQPCS